MSFRSGARGSRRQSWLYPHYTPGLAWCRQRLVNDASPRGPVGGTRPWSLPSLLLVPRGRLRRQAGSGRRHHADAGRERSFVDPEGGGVVGRWDLGVWRASAQHEVAAGDPREELRHVVADREGGPDGASPVSDQLAAELEHGPGHVRMVAEREGAMDQVKLRGDLELGVDLEQQVPQPAQGLLAQLRGEGPQAATDDHRARHHVPGPVAAHVPDRAPTARPLVLEALYHRP